MLVLKYYVCVMSSIGYLVIKGYRMNGFYWVIWLKNLCKLIFSNIFLYLLRGLWTEVVNFGCWALGSNFNRFLVLFFSFVERAVKSLGFYYFLFLIIVDTCIVYGITVVLSLLFRFTHVVKYPLCALLDSLFPKYLKALFILLEFS